MEMGRYSRQILFPPIGEAGQEKLKKGRAAIVGMGALGTVIASHLVRAGVGFIRIIDRDIIELSNLQRQTLYTEKDAFEQLPKAIAARQRLGEINSNVKIEAVLTDLNLDNGEDLLKDVNVVIDGTDNFATRYLINDIAVKHNIPWIYGGAVSSRGMFAVIHPGTTPCYRCLFPDAPAGRGETCDTVGVISPITDIIGSFEAVEALKILVGEKSNQNLEQFDIWVNEYFQMDITQGKNPACPCCVGHQFDFLDRTSNSQTAFTSLCGRNTVQINPRSGLEIDFAQTAERLRKIGRVEYNSFLLRFFPDNDITLIFFKTGRAMVHGTNDVAKAKSYYSKYIGS